MPSWPTDAPNPVDLIAFVLILLYALQGFQHGWLLSVVELAGFALSLFLGLTLYAPVAHLLVGSTELPYGLSKPLAFLIVWGASDLLYGLFIRATAARQLRRARHSPFSRLLAIWPGVARGILAVMVLLAISATIPFPAPIQAALEESRLAQTLQPRATALAQEFSQVFDDAVQETVGLLTVRPESSESIPLRFRVQDPPFDPAAEGRMLELLNRERTERGLNPLVIDETLRESARRHSVDMFQRGYFAHVDPEGRTPFERMRSTGARFRAAGENLALAPTVEIAHNGLMNSPGHRANILSTSFGRVGIGAADGGLHGKMFTQNFAN
jgi:uncharacterized protein YkwD